MSVRLEILTTVSLAGQKVEVGGLYSSGKALVLEGGAQVDLTLSEFFDKLAGMLGESDLLAGAPFAGELAALELRQIEMAVERATVGSEEAVLLVLEAVVTVGKGPGAFELDLVGATDGSRLLAGIDLEGSFDLARLPLVGKAFPEGGTPALDGLQVVVAGGKTSWSESEVKALNVLLGQLERSASAPARAPFPEQEIAAGVGLGALFRLGGEIENLLFQAGADASPPGISARQPAEGGKVVAASGAGGKGVATPGAVWVKVQKTLGPVYVDKVGMAYGGGGLALLLDASLTAAGLTLSLEGLEVGSKKLWPIEPIFGLEGLGLDYRRGPLEIGGAFLAGEAKTADGKKYTDYSGIAVLGMEELHLAAMGRYADPPGGGGPSVFVYGVLDQPLGGPPFAFVTGLAAGFGYHRSLKVPPLSEVASFPLVAEAVSGAAAPAGASDLAGELEKLDRYVTVDPGEDFLAIGVRFSSFEMIDTFALLTASFGERFEIDVLGLSTLVVPTPEATSTEPVLAEAQLALEGRYVPSEGLLGVEGQLTRSSWILDKSCRLRGGFAFYSWFDGDDAGDFVVTFGGYYPGFHKPGHYPSVPRLGIDWRVSSEVSVTGDAYYALTPSQLMAGGHLKATWHSGPFKAWFTVGADFLIGWKPFHYQASAHVGIGASYTYHFFGTHHLTVNVGADLELWGPEFSGTAHVDLKIVSFTVSFGGASRRKPPAIDWSGFRKSFLPAARSPRPVAGVTVAAGLLGTAQPQSPGEPAVWVVNPKQLALVTSSAIPSTGARYGLSAGAPSLATNLGDRTAETAIGLAPMGVTTGVASTHAIEIDKKSETGKPEYSPVLRDKFTCTPILRSGPAALWGNQGTSVPSGAKPVENLLMGYRLTPLPPKAPDTTAPMNLQALDFDISAPPPIDWAPGSTWTESEVASGSAAQQVLEKAIGKAVQPATAELLRACGVLEIDKPLGSSSSVSSGLEAELVTVTGDFTRHLVVAPHIGSLGVDR